MNSQQEQINQIAQELQTAQAGLEAVRTDVANLGDGVTSLEANVSTLQQQLAAAQAGGTLDLTALQGTADALASAVSGLRTTADAAAAKLPAAPASV